jgi:hypothetical protein
MRAFRTVLFDAAIFFLSLISFFDGDYHDEADLDIRGLGIRRPFLVLYLDEG